MTRTSQHSSGLVSRLLEIEEYFQRGDPESALQALEKLEQSPSLSEGEERGLYLLLRAHEALLKNQYQTTISLCNQALDEIGTTNLNRRIGRLQLLLYKSYMATGDIKQAETFVRDALASFRRVKDTMGIIDAYNGIGRIYYMQSDYALAAESVNRAVAYAAEVPERMSMLLANLGRIYLFTGQMGKAEANLREALRIDQENGLLYNRICNYLSLGYFHLRRRQFHLAESEFADAYQLLKAHSFRREMGIYLEYAGELALEKQDFVTARTHLEQAVALARELSPESSLLCQSLRLLAEVTLALGHHEEAMRSAQQVLDMAQKIGEKAEVGHAHRVIADIFLSRGEITDARHHVQLGIEVFRENGDIYLLGRAIVTCGLVMLADADSERRDDFLLLQESEKIFLRLEDEYYLAETHFLLGRLCHREGRNGEALEYLKKAISGFQAVDYKVGVRKVGEFLQSLSQSAIEKALSNDNQFKIFGNVISNSEYKDLATGPLDKLFELLIEKTAAERAFIISLVQGEKPEISACRGIAEEQLDSITERFAEFLHHRVISGKPILMLDCSNEADIADLIPAGSDRVSCLMILPLVFGTEVIGYIYLDRIVAGVDQNINPFSQNEIDFAVAFADLVAFKASEYQKEKILEDNYRLKAQLLERCVFPNIVTQSRPFMEMLARVRQVSNSNMAVFISGETGTGKDLLAKAIHYNSNRRDKRFISVNCAALPESLLESELFGYKKGAFTGADRDKSGLFEAADGGTFFLDEIADMPQAIQAKILRVLEDQEITRLGDTQPRRVNVRIISATNKDLEIEMQEKRFRSDLYYRLCALHFAIPPLRDRREDIPLLIEHFLSGTKCRISSGAMKYLVDYDWPGNVRELENEIKKLVLLANNEGVITASLLSSRTLGDKLVSGNGDIDEMTPPSLDSFSLYEYIAEYEKRFIIKAMKEQGGVKKRAADSLKIPESTLRLKLKQYNIDPKNLDSIN